MTDTDTTDAPPPSELDLLIDEATAYARGVFENAEMANPDQTALAAAILSGVSQPSAIDAEDTAAIVNGAVELAVAGLDGLITSKIQVFAASKLGGGAKGGIGTFGGGN